MRQKFGQNWEFMNIDPEDTDLLEGKRGPAMKLAMELVLQAARIMGAERLVPVTFAHLDACTSCASKRVN